MINHYNLSNDIKFLAKSEIRLKILSELQKKPKSIKELVKDTKITYSSISSNLAKHLIITSTFDLTLHSMLLLDVIVVKCRCCN